ncbi:MAG: nucleolar RNA-binding Nop10p family protein [Candidatus Woesearchaeota archaeon]
MAKHILYCSTCQRYTMQPVCTCGEKTAERKPAKFSPEDKYAQYRRQVKQEQRKKEGLV